MNRRGARSTNSAADWGCAKMCFDTSYGDSDPVDYDADRRARELYQLERRFQRPGVAAVLKALRMRRRHAVAS